MLIFPAIDLLGGRCVRLAQGDYARATCYHDDPLWQAAEFRAQGAEWLHVVDLDAARSGEPVNLPIILRLAAESGLKLQVGGGVRKIEHAERLMASGVQRMVAGTALVQSPDFAAAFFKLFGEAAVAGLDLRDGRVAAHGWEQTSDLQGLDFARQLQDIGCVHVVLTDIAKDGMGQGPNFDLLSEFTELPGLAVIASGGVGSVAEIQEAKRRGAAGAIIGKALYEGTTTLRHIVAECSHGDSD